MSTAASTSGGGTREQGRSEFGVALFLGAVGLLVLVSALLLPESRISRGPVGPAAVPIVVAILLMVTGAILFWGAAFALGSRHWIRDAVIAFVLSIGTWYVFALGLGIVLPPGILEGIL
jgi:putative tricarboxylic transport membrane protein